ncbi:MAG: hypothetical protein NUW07_04255, partial [Candidatus Saccharicenans sp.]|nr:hypothetical protein [Candidatus Saccharicenans sp.]
LLVGVDGQFTLVTEATEWLEATAGVRGGTFLWIPTGFKTFYSLNKGFEADAHFLGQLKGYVKAGPLLDLDILGWSLVGAGFTVGLGLDSQTFGSLSEAMLDVQIYGSIELYVSLFKHRLNIINNKYNLYHFQKPDSQGYDVRYYEVCAWRGSIWGNIKKEQNGEMVAVQEPLVLEVKRNDQVIGRLQAPPDSSGDFQVSVNFPLYQGDRVRVIKVGVKDINSASVNPTIPFSDIRLDYADFFNDRAIGQVSAAKVKNWKTGQWEYVNYTGNIRFNNGAMTSCDNEGNFTLNYDFKPGQNVAASIEYNGFSVTSPGITTDTALLGWRVLESSELSEYTDSSGRAVEKRLEKEHFYVTNLRGDKQFLEPATYYASYFFSPPLSRVFEYFSGRPIIQPVLLGERLNNFRFAPKGIGASEIQADFIEEWGWKPGSGGEVGLEKAARINNQLSQVTTTSAAGLRVSSQPCFRYDADKTRAQGDPVNEGIRSLLRKGYLVGVYEGAEIEIRDQEQTRGHEQPRTGVNPGEQELLDRINSRINPARLSKIDPVSSRITVPLNQIRIQREVRR